MLSFLRFIHDPTLQSANQGPTFDSIEITKDVSDGIGSPGESGYTFSNSCEESGYPFLQRAKFGVALAELMDASHWG